MHHPAARVGSVATVCRLVASAEVPVVMMAWRALAPGRPFAPEHPSSMIIIAASRPIPIVAVVVLLSRRAHVAAAVAGPSEPMVVVNTMVLLVSPAWPHKAEPALVSCRFG